MIVLRSCFKLVKGKFLVHKPQDSLCWKDFLLTSSYQFGKQSHSSPLSRDSAKKKMSDFIYPNETPVKLADCEKAFSALTEREKKYVHYLSKACYYGGLIILPQISVESSLIFVLLHKLFKSQPLSELRQTALHKCNFSEDEYNAVLAYAAGFLSNMGNYKGSGDTKFVPNYSKEKFKDLVLASAVAAQEPDRIQNILSCCLDSIFSLEDNEKQLGFPYVGKTTYLSKNFAKEDLDPVNNFFKKQKMEPTNTRLVKTVDEVGATCYEIRLASVLQNDDEEEKNILSTHTVNGHKFLVTRGDYSRLLKIVNKYLLIAEEYAANENEIKMLESYVKSFQTGSVEWHKDGSRYWIKDKGPVVESHIGFIENYRDPSGIRAEFEGFVAIVDKASSVKFTNLVEAATDLLPLLPWPVEYEKDKFLCPDFTSLDVVAYAASSIPYGICLPNYEDIRQYEGFKNVCLRNIFTTRSMKDLNYLCKQDQELLDECFNDSFELQIALHELIGHGSGKLFQTNADGTLNFNIDEVIHLETNEKISKHYKEGETYDTVFGNISSSYEECRAECCGLYLCLDPTILKIFGHEGSRAERIIFCNWLDLCYKGIEALQMYEPKTDSWLQAHAQARYAILQVCLEAGEGFVNIEQTKGSDGNPDLLFTMDFNKIKTVGKKAIGNFLRKLQVYKATADISSAKAMFGKYSAVTSEDRFPFLNYREIVMARKKPRDMFVLTNTVIKNDKVHLINYGASHEGIIQSWVDRLQDDDVYSILEEIWEKDRLYF